MTLIAVCSEFTGLFLVLHKAKYLLMHILAGLSCKFFWSYGVVHEKLYVFYIEPEVHMALLTIYSELLPVSVIAQRQHFLLLYCFWLYTSYS